MPRTRKPSREELEARIANMQAYELLASLRHVQYVGSPVKTANRAPIVKRETIEAHGGRYDVTVTYYGHWRMDTGVIEVVAWPLRDDDTRGDGPLVEVHGGLWAADATRVFRAWQDDATYRAPWAHLVRWVLSDGVRLANEADDAAKKAATSKPTTRELHNRDIHGGIIPHTVNPGPTLLCAGCGLLRFGSDFLSDHVDAPCSVCRGTAGLPHPAAYRLHQYTDEGPWVSEVFQGSAFEARKAVAAGWLIGQPRWAVEEGTYRFLYGLDADGKPMKEAPPDPPELP